MTTRQALAAVVAVAGVGAGFALAQDGGAAAAKPVKVGYVNVRQVLQDYRKTGALDQELRDRSAKLEQRIAEMEKEKSQLETNLRVHPKGTQMYREKLREIYEKEQAIAFQQKWSRVELDNQAAESTLEIYKDLLDAVKKVAQEKGYGLVCKFEDREIEADGGPEMNLRINMRTVLFCDLEHDLTKAVLERLDADWLKANPGTPPGGGKPADKPADKPAGGSPAGGGEKPAGGGK